MSRRRSASAKVARAARTTGGRTPGTGRSWGWYSVMAAVVVLGTVALIASRSDYLEANDAAGGTEPRPPDRATGFSGDHWHVAYGIYICDRFLPPIESQRDPVGIHTHGDGVIHVHPFGPQASGPRANLGAFTMTVGISISTDTLRLPDGRTYTNGEECGDKRGKVTVLVNGEETTSDFASIRLRDRDHLVMAFAPEGAHIPATPPSAPNLDNLSDVPKPTPEGDGIGP